MTRKLDIPDICQDCLEPKAECVAVAVTLKQKKKVVAHSIQCSNCLRGTDPRNCPISSGLWVALVSCGHVRPEIAEKYQTKCPDQTRMV